MKKFFYVSGILLVLAFLSIGIVESITTLANDLNTHLLLNIIGRWQCSEKGYYEIEFNIDETFSEYYYGIEKSSGTLQIDNNRIVLMYDVANCKATDGNDCVLQINYDYEVDILVLIVNDQRLTFYRVVEQ